MTGDLHDQRARADRAEAALRVVEAAFAASWAPVLAALNGRLSDTPDVAEARDGMFDIERKINAIRNALRRMREE